MTDIYNDTRYLPVILIRSANSIFQWGFMYYAVFLYLIRNRHYKVPNQKMAERQKTYVCSWMLLLWMMTVFSALFYDLTFT